MKAPAESQYPENVCSVPKQELVLGHLLKSCSRKKIHSKKALSMFILSLEAAFIGQE